MTPGDARLGDAVCDALDADYFVRRERERERRGSIPRPPPTVTFSSVCF